MDTYQSTMYMYSSLTIAQLKKAFFDVELFSKEHSAIMEELFTGAIERSTGNLLGKTKPLGFLQQEQIAYLTGIIKAFPEIVLDTRFDRTNERLECEIVRNVSYGFSAATEKFPQLIPIIQDEWLKLITPCFSHTGIIALEYFDPFHQAKPFYQDQEIPEPYYPLIPIVKRIAESRPSTSYGDRPFVLGASEEKYFHLAKDILECYRRYFIEKY